MNITRFYFSAVIVSLSLFLSACSPHPATGVWKATGDNSLGIDRLVAGFEGRVEFTTSKINNAVWHCFWGAANKKILKLNCAPSTNTEEKRLFTLSINEQGLAELRDDNSAEGASAETLPVLATFIRLDEDPSPRKKK
jgi:hypothetical protein